MRRKPPTPERFGGMVIREIGVDDDEEEAAPKGVLTLDDWLKRDMPEQNHLLGNLLSTTSRALIVGPTGLGKTMFGLALGIAIASNAGFLHWAAGSKAARVLYVDGEMSRGLMKRRLHDEVRRSGLRPEPCCPKKTTRTCRRSTPQTVRSG